MTDNGRVRVDPQDLTLGEYADIEAELGEPLDVLLAGTGKWRAMAAMVWAFRRRENPSYTLAEASTLKMRDIELVAADDDAVPLEPSAQAGAPPPSSPEPGPSTPSP